MGKGVDRKDTITLYRGLGLPVEAVEAYDELLKSGDEFNFTGFMSTSLDMDVAL